MSCVLRVSGLGVELAGREILKDVDLRVDAGQLVGLIGPNGAGKTTLMRAIMGLVPRVAGEVELAGKVGYVPQRQDLDWNYPMAVEDLVATAFIGNPSRSGKRGKERWAEIYRALAKVDMYQYAQRTIAELSGGQRQRVLIARALAPNPAILLLDEPFTGLDYPNQDSLTDLLTKLAESGVALLMATHDLTQAMTNCDQLVMLNRKVRACGKPADLLRAELWMNTYAVNEDSALLHSIGLVNA